jgi:hypothetical protein
MRVLVLLSACLALGCTRANSDYDNGGRGGAPGGGGAGGSGVGVGGNGGGVDAGVPVSDMASLPMPSGGPDLAMSSPPDLLQAVCSPGTRRCITMPIDSEVCAASGQWGVDRGCPWGSRTKTGADCRNGYCAPPTANHLVACDRTGARESDCGMGNLSPDYSCQPFITDPANVNPDWYCAIAVVQGAGQAGDPCKTGADCHGGWCGSNGTCFWACQFDHDCPPPRGGHTQLTCNQVTLHVEGKVVMEGSCTP